MQQVRVTVIFWMRPFSFPHRQRLNANACVQQNVICNVVHRHFGFDERANCAFENDGHVRITFILLGAPRTAAEKITFRVGET